MKFPSFIKVPRARGFQMEPRYYDPVKEEIKERTERIRREMKGESAGAYQPGRISFERRATQAPNSSLLQLAIASILGLGVIGWLYLGNDILHALWLAVPVYLYFRFKKPSRSDR